MTMKTTTDDNDLRRRAQQLGLYGLLVHWEEVGNEPWVERFILWQTAERQRRSLERRIRNARIGAFKPMVDFDWKWPKRIDRALIDELFTLHFMSEPANVVLIGPNGVGKSMIARNLAHRAIMLGYTARFCTASELLNDLAAQDGTLALQRRFLHYTRPQLLVIDEVGYLSYDLRHADLLFEIVTRRYGEKSILITTNKPFAEWNEVFPNASCVVTLVDRLLHKAEIVQLDAESYRLKEAKERAARRKKKRNSKSRQPRR